MRQCSTEQGDFGQTAILRLVRCTSLILARYGTGHVTNAADPPSRPVAQQHQPSQDRMDGSQLVQWLSAQASNMAGALQHNVKALMLRVSSPMPVSDGRDDLVPNLRKQLRHQQQAHREMQTILKNQVLAIEAFNGRWLVKKHMHLLDSFTVRGLCASGTYRSSAI